VGIEINQRPLTVTADAKQKMLSQVDPELTYQLTSGSLVNGNALTGELVRESGEEAGTYAINQGTLTAGSNYNLNYVGANLTIHAIPTVNILNPAPVHYGHVINVAAEFTAIVNNPV